MPHNIVPLSRLFFLSTLSQWICWGRVFLSPGLANQIRNNTPPCGPDTPDCTTHTDNLPITRCVLRIVTSGCRITGDERWRRLAQNSVAKAAVSAGWHGCRCVGSGRVEGCKAGALACTQSEAVKETASATLVTSQRTVFHPLCTFPFSHPTPAHSRVMYAMKP